MSWSATRSSLRVEVIFGRVSVLNAAGMLTCEILAGARDALFRTSPLELLVFGGGAFDVCCLGAYVGPVDHAHAWDTLFAGSSWLWVHLNSMRMWPDLFKKIFPPE